MKSRTLEQVSMRSIASFYLRTALILVALSSSLFSINISAEMRDRVRIQGNNVVADNGKPLRGSAFFLDVFSIEDMRNNESAYRNYFRSISRDYNMNLVRVCPWVGNWEYMNKTGRNSEYYDTHKRDYLYMMDKVVKWAEEDGIYAMVNLTMKFGTRVELQKVKDYWNVVAPRYKDKTHVLYEVVNEPEIPTAKAQMKNVYSFVRSLAPQTHLVLWSPNNPSALSANEIRNNSNGISYQNASVGFHIYEYLLGKREQHDIASGYRDAGFPVIATEFYSLTDADYYPIDYDFLTDNISVMENRGFSWTQWAPVFHYRFGNAGNSKTHDEVKFSSRYTTALRNKGIRFWAKDNQRTVADNQTNDSQQDASILGVKRVQDAWKKRFFHQSQKDDWTPLVNAAGNANWVSQQWKIIDAGNNTFRIQNNWSKDYLTPGSKNEWDTVYTAPLNTNWSSQRWRITRAGQFYRIQNVWSGLYLSVPSENYGEIKQAELRSGWSSQKFKLMNP